MHHRTLRRCVIGLSLSVVGTAAALAQDACFPQDPWGGEIPCMQSGYAGCYRYQLDKVPENVGYIESERMFGYGDKVAGVLGDAAGALGQVMLGGGNDGSPVTLYARVGSDPTPDQFDCRAELALGQLCTLPRGADVHYLIQAGGTPTRVHFYAFPM